MTTSCAYFQSGSCSSCSQLPSSGQFDNFEYSKHLKAKQDQLLSFFSRDQLSEFVPSLDLSGFRSKARFSFFQDQNGIRLGYFGDQQSFHELADCPAHHPDLTKLSAQILKLLPDFNFSIFDIKKQTGELKNLILIRSEDSSIGVKFVLRSPALKSKLKNLARALVATNSNIKYVVMNLQPQSSAILEGELEETIFGVPELKMTYGSLEVAVPSKSFSQVNAKVASQLYQTAAKYLRDQKVEKVLDLFCGAGGFLLSCQDFLNQGLGVELSASSVRSANQLCQSKAITNLKFQALDLSESFNFESIAQTFASASKAVIVNPPRRGLGLNLARQLNESGFEHLVYSSCSLESLVKDRAELSNYEVHRVQGFDMFPWTPHMEVLVGFTRKSL